MRSKVNFMMAIHCHQPPGQFGGVLEEAYEKAYLPFIETLDKHPKIRIALHYSGSLLEWLKKKRPEFIEKIKNKVKDGQIEMIGGGYYEPILSLLPVEDAIAQVRMLKRTIEKLFSYKVMGGWLTERIWEPGLPFILKDAGILYTLVDDSHFRFAGIDSESVSGYYITEERGNRLYLFPLSERLRYTIPFKLPQVSLNYLRAKWEKGYVSVCYGDDGEKFGLWPGTHKWVYKERWLENFFSLLEKNLDWINLLGFSEFISQFSPQARAYLSCASYREMLEWSGGFFRNFLIKYPEVNNMHKKMLYVSKKIQSLSKKMTRKKLSEARRCLYRAQANDVYWHGVFGGLYLNHLRQSVYQNLIRAERICDEVAGNNFEFKELDIDLDGHRELLVNSPNLNIYLRPDFGGSIYEWDYKPRDLNLTNTIARRPEVYHRKVLERQKTSLPINGNNPKSPNFELATIHNIQDVKEDGLGDILFYDPYPRYSLLDHFLDYELKSESFFKGEYRERGDFILHPYQYHRNKAKGITLSRRGEVDSRPFSLSKHIKLEDKGINLEYELSNLDNTKISFIFGVEFNLSVYDPQLNHSLLEEKVSNLELRDLWNGIKISFLFVPSCFLWNFPVETVSESESGIERTYQELCLFFHWKREFIPKESWKAQIKVELD